MPWIDADNDGEHYLVDDDESSTPFDPTSEDAKWNDSDGDGIPDVLDLTPDDPNGPSGHVPGGLLGQFSPELFRAFFQAEFGVEWPANVPLPGEFSDLNGDGHLSIHELAKQLMDTLKPHFDAAAHANNLDAMIELQGVAVAMAVFDPAIGLAADGWGARIARFQEKLSAHCVPGSSSLSGCQDEQIGSAELNASTSTSAAGSILSHPDGFVGLVLSVFDIYGYYELPSTGQPQPHPGNPNKSTTGDPVDTARGEFLYSTVDFFASGRGVDLSISRHYRSRDLRSGLVGPNWSIPLLETHMLIYKSMSGGNALNVFWGDGSRSVLRPTAHPLYQEILWQGVNGCFAKAQFTPSGYDEEECAEPIDGDPLRDSIVLRQPDGMQYYFCPPSAKVGTANVLVCYLRKVVDPYGNAITLRRDAEGKPYEIIDTLGRTLALEYDPETSRLITVTDWIGRTTNYTYDELTGDLVLVEYPPDVHLLDSDVASSGRSYEYYEYDQHPLGYEESKDLTLNHNLRLVQREDSGPQIEIAYHTNLDYKHDRVSTLTDAGGVTHFLYQGPDDLGPDAYGQDVTHVTRAVYPDGDSEVFYHGNGLLLRHERCNGRFGADGTPVGGPSEPGGPASWLTLYSYSTEMLLVETLSTTSAAHPIGRRTVLEYDHDAPDRFRHGNLLRVEVHPDPTQHPVPTPQVNELQYEPITANPVVIVDPDGRTTLLFYGHQELSYEQVREHPLVRDWDILPLVPDEPWLWGHGDLNGDGQAGFGIARQVMPPVEIAGTSGPGVPGSTENPIFTYGYNLHGQVVYVEDPSGTRHSIDYSGGYPAHRTADPGGLHIRTSFGRDALGQVVHKRKPNGGTDHFAYNANGQPKWSTSRDVCPGGHDGVPCVYHHGIWERYYYDSVGRPAGFVLPYFGGAPLGSIDAYSPELGTRLRYDTSGNLTTIEERLLDGGSVLSTGIWSRSFDGRGRLQNTTTPTGFEQTIERSPRGLPVAVQVADPIDGRSGVWTFEYNAYDEIVRQVGPQSVGSPETLIVRDGFGRVTEIVNPDGSRTELSLDVLGRVTRKKSVRGSTVTEDVTIEWDALDRETRVVTQNLVEDHQGVVTVGTPSEFEVRYGRGLDPGRIYWKALAYDGTYHVERYEQDALLRLTGVFQGSGNELGVRYDLDQMGNPVTVTEYRDGRGASGAVSPSVVASYWEYDEHARPTRLTDPAGGQTTFEYDAWRNLTRRTDPTGMTSSAFYDGLGRLRSTTQLGFGQSRTWTLDRDVAGRVSQIHGPEGRWVSYDRNAEGLVTSHRVGTAVRTDYQFDALGRLLAESNPQGMTRLYQYDALDRLISRTSAGEGPSVQQAYTWSTAGQVVQVSDAVAGNPARVTRRRYNALGQLVMDQHTAGGVSAPVVAGYDGRGLVRSLSLPFAHGLTYGYDSRGRLANVASSRSGTLLSVTAPYGSSQFRRGDLSCGGNLLREFDPAGRVTLLEAYGGSGSLLAGESYAYDLAGRLLERTSLHEPRRQEVTYDALDRIGQWVLRDTQTQGVLRQVGFVWDKEDNLVQRTDSVLGTRTGAYDGGNRLDSLLPLWNALLYSSEGAEASRQSYQDNGRQWAHDALGRPLECVIDQAGGPPVTVQWVYDGFGRMVERYQDGVLDEAYRYFGNYLVSLRQGAAWSDLVPAGPSGDSLCLVDGQGEVNYLFTDPMGNVAGEFSCNTLSSWRPMDPFGVGVASDGSAPTFSSLHGRLGFQGRPFDGALGSYRLGHRVFDPMAARFLSRDPLGEIDSSNGYQYGIGDPYRWRDPLGLSGSATQTPEIQEPGCPGGVNIRQGGANFLETFLLFTKEHYTSLGWDKPRLPRSPREVSRILRLMIEINNYYLDIYNRLSAGALTDEELDAIEGMTQQDAAGLVWVNQAATSALMVSDAPEVARKIAQEAAQWYWFGGVTKWAPKAIAIVWKYAKPAVSTAARGVANGVKKLVGAAKAAEPAGAGAARGGAQSAANGLRLQKQLGSAEQLADLASGGGRAIAGAGTKTPIRDVGRLVDQYGGSASDWAKISSGSRVAADGTRFEIHAFRNVTTGQCVEAKTKLWP